MSVMKYSSKISSTTHRLVKVTGVVDLDDSLDGADIHITAGNLNFPLDLDKVSDGYTINIMNFSYSSVQTILLYTDRPLNICDSRSPGHQIEQAAGSLFKIGSNNQCRVIIDKTDNIIKVFLDYGIRLYTKNSYFERAERVMIHSTGDEYFTNDAHTSPEFGGFNLSDDMQGLSQNKRENAFASQYLNSDMSVESGNWITGNAWSEGSGHRHSIASSTILNSSQGNFDLKKGRTYELSGHFHIHHVNSSCYSYMIWTDATGVVGHSKMGGATYTGGNNSGEEQMDNSILATVTPSEDITVFLRVQESNDSIILQKTSSNRGSLIICKEVTPY